MNRPVAKELDDPLWSLAHYVAGYFPLYNLEGEFYWERLPERAVVPIDEETVRRAKGMGRRSRGKFRIEKNRRFKECIRHLQDPRVKEYSWVQREVVRIYEAFRKAGLLVTVEAVNGEGELAGGLVGIVLPGVLIAETMFGLEADASKACLCAVVEDARACGFALIDVQTRHDLDPWEGKPYPKERSPHPCVRLGEEVWRIERFRRTLARVLGENWPGTIEDWVEAGRQVAEGREGEAGAKGRRWLELGKEK
jgi:leucyl/phenylalanyl-tRNA--protein transferase